uniref:Senescence domain-containing protein n=1 Tax=Romanomermis culicivorax TaxID=13658 RepID=A0A915J2M9_ROMCU
MESKSNECSKPEKPLHQQRSSSHTETVTVESSSISANSGSSATESSNRTISDIYQEAYAVIDQGICCDEVGYVDGAIQMYENGLSLVDEARKIRDAEKSETFMKMDKARQHIIDRLSDLRPVRSLKNDGKGINAATSPTPIDAINETLSCLGNVKNAEELLVIPDGVQLFYIKGQETSIPSYPSSLKILKFSDCSSSNNKVKVDIMPAFLQISDWVYPLSPGRSPVLHSTYGAYIFPDPTVDDLDRFVGIILPKDLDPKLTADFMKLMKEYTTYKEETSPPVLTAQEEKRLATKIASFLISGSEFVVRQLKSGSDKSSEYICRKSMKIRDNTSNYCTITVDPRVQTSVHYLRKGTKVAVKVSGYLVDKIGALGATIGQRIATSVDKRLQSTGGKDSGAKVVKDLLFVTSAGVSGIATIWIAMEEVSKTLAKCIANETVVVVDHKYGQQAANVTDNVLYSAGFAAATAWNLENLGIKGIAKRSAKSASIAFLRDLNKPSSLVENCTKSDETSSPCVEPKKRTKKN